MLNKELLLAQKQGLQDGEFLLTIGTADGAYGFFARRSRERFS